MVWVVILGQEDVDHIQNVLLSATRKSGNSFKGFAGTTNWPVSFGLFVIGEEIDDIHSKNTRQLLKLGGSQTDVTAFPSGVGRLRDVHCGGDLTLSELGIFA